MSQPPSTPYSGPPYPEQPQHGQQPASGQPYPGQPYPGPNPDVPASVPPGYQPYGQQPPLAPDYSQQGGYQSPMQPGQPEHPQPGYTQPGYTQPEHAQPGYTQPGYGQPGYAQPGYAQPAGGYPGAPPPKKSKALPIVLISIAVVLVLCVGGGTAVYLAARTKANDIVEAVKQAESATPTVPSTTEPTTDPTPTEESSNITLTAPKTLGGRPELTDPQFASLAENLESGLADVPGSTNSIGAIYGTVAKRNIVIIAGAEAPIDDPAGDLNDTFVGAGISGLKISNITRVEPGSLGGSAKCGKADDQSIDMVLCGWADEGSRGWVIFFAKSVGSAKSEFPKLRAEIEKKSN